MLRYFQWLAIAGVWGPLLVLLAWLGMSWSVYVGSSEASGAGWGLAVGGMLLTAAAAHALAVSSLIGIGLLALRKAARVTATALSALVGGALSTLVLGRIYFNLWA